MLGKRELLPRTAENGFELGVTRQMVNSYLHELKQHKYINWERRGLGKTNVYYILDYQPLDIEADVKQPFTSRMSTAVYMQM